MDNQPVRKKNRHVVGIMVAIVVILSSVGVYSHAKENNNKPEVPEPSNQTILPTPKAIQPFSFSITDSHDQFTNKNLKGHWTFMFFGFTHCGDVCPLTLAELSKMDQQLQKDLPAKKLPQVIFVTVDPQRDTIKILRNYVKNFNNRFIGASGTAEDLEVFKNDLGMYYAKNPSKDNQSYSMNHSSQIYLINPDGNWAGVITYPFHADQLVKNYKALVNSQ